MAPNIVPCDAIRGGGGERSSGSVLLTMAPKIVPYDAIWEGGVRESSGSVVCILHRGSHACVPHSHAMGEE